MSITATTLTVAVPNPPGRTLFAISFYSADASGTETIKAAPATGKAIYITNLQVAADVAGTISVGDETTDIKVIATDTGLTHNISFTRPIKLADATPLVVSGSAGPVSGIVEGFVSA